jgi:hypothetical protein
MRINKIYLPRTLVVYQRPAALIELENMTIHNRTRPYYCTFVVNLLKESETYCIVAGDPALYSLSSPNHTVFRKNERDDEKNVQKRRGSGGGAYYLTSIPLRNRGRGIEVGGKRSGSRQNGGTLNQY